MMKNNKTLAIYKAPQTKVVELHVQTLICQSKIETGGFSLRDDFIERGSDSDWNDDGEW